jgi:hypothetical protein
MHDTSTVLLLSVPGWRMEPCVACQLIPYNTTGAATIASSY